MGSLFIAPRASKRGTSIRDIRSLTYYVGFDRMLQNTALLTLLVKELEIGGRASDECVLS